MFYIVFKNQYATKFFSIARRTQDMADVSNTTDPKSLHRKLTNNPDYCILLSSKGCADSDSDIAAASKQA